MVFYDVQGNLPETIPSDQMTVLVFIVLEMYNFGEGKATGRLPSVKIEALVNRHLEMQ